MSAVKLSREPWIGFLLIEIMDWFNSGVGTEVSYHHPVGLSQLLLGDALGVTFVRD